MPCSSVRAALLSRRNGHAVQFTLWPVGRSRKKKKKPLSPPMDGTGSSLFRDLLSWLRQTCQSYSCQNAFHHPAPTWLDNGNRHRRLRNADLRIGPPLLSSRLHLGRPRFERASHTATSTHETGLAPVIIRPPDGPEADESRENRKEASSWDRGIIPVGRRGGFDFWKQKQKPPGGSACASVNVNLPQGSTGHVWPKQQQTRFRPSVAMT